MPSETVLITGASTGIGRELARLFAQDGAKLILTARSADKLRELANELKQKYQTESVVIPMDLGDPASPKILVDEIASQGLQVDILINNAGFGQFGRFHEIPLERHLSMLRLNICALTELTYRIVPQMLERQRGNILNIGSTASFQPGPNSAVYYASKGYVLSMSEALYVECKKKNVWVSCLCPGPTRTPFATDSNMANTPVFRFNSMNVEDVAKAGHAAVRGKRRLVVPGFFNKLGAFFTRITVKPVLLWFMERLQPIND